ncbi:MAG: DUF3500 domain-containing protein [Myxococcota bacterium]
MVVHFACSGDGTTSNASTAGNTSSSSSSTSSSSSSSSTGGTTSSSGASGSGGTADCTNSATTFDNTAAVVGAANALLAALTEEQRTAIQYETTLANAQQWSNFPITFVQRNGVRIGDMSAEAQTAAQALVDVAAGATGSTLLTEAREADEWLVTDGNASSTDYGRGLYYFSIHGTPSTTSAWMLQIAGHHLAYNFTYNGRCTSATPLFDGVEPTTWTDGNGQSHAPLEAQRAAGVALLASVGTAAQLTGTFSDLVNGPAGGGPGGGGGGDTKYPSSLVYPSGTTGRGVAVSTLSADQKELVKTAMAAWVNNVADPVAAALLADYQSDEALNETYVGYSGSADLTTQSSYFRIDGPRVWIEFSVQGGIVYRDRVHYHTIWRDKASDYGAEYVSQ